MGWLISTKVTLVTLALHIGVTRARYPLIPTKRHKRHQRGRRDNSPANQAPILPSPKKIRQP
jgi:hypothetical protein